jgi:Mn2+/Fe2+ NRAMP family transporter
VTSAASQRVVIGMFVIALVVYAALALAAHRWVSGAAAPVVAGLLARRHPRARFSAYVFFSVLVLRGLAVGAWALVTFGLASVLVLQTSPARRAWPRLTGGRARATRDTPRST